MTDFPWKAGTCGTIQQGFLTRAAAERWCEQFENRMSVWYEPNTPGT